MKNFHFLVLLLLFFCFVDRQMGPPQWSDLGMFLQTFMLLAKEAGLDTCAQEAWSMKHDSVSKFVEAEDSDILFCGMAIGYRDEDAAVNSLKSDRRPLKSGQNFFKSIIYLIFLQKEIILKNLCLRL
jgi:nitroreductase